MFDCLVCRDGSVPVYSSETFGPVSDNVQSPTARSFKRYVNPFNPQAGKLINEKYFMAQAL